jgi:hypothetical protein
MNREEAIDKADVLVSIWMEQVKNNRGYVADGWKPADPTLRTDAILRIATFLAGPPIRVVPPIQVGEEVICHWCENDEIMKRHHHPGGTPEHRPI